LLLLYPKKIKIKNIATIFFFDKLQLKFKEEKKRRPNTIAPPRSAVILYNRFFLFLNPSTIPPLAVINSFQLKSV
jgi:hypothetical protein